MDPFVVETGTTQIAAGQSLSPAAGVGPKTLIGIEVPSNWTTAAITLQASVDGVTWSELVDQTATAIGSSSVIASDFVAIDPAKLRGVQALKIRSGTAGSPINQVNAVTLTLVRRDVF